MSTDGDYLRKLIKKRDSASRRIVRIANNLRDSVAVEGDDMAIDAARIDRDDLEKCFQLFEGVQNEIEEELSGDELEAQEDERVRIETLVRNTRVSASNFLRRNTILPEVNSNPAVVTVPSTKIKRPEITVPKFSGDVKKWSEFKNVFKSLVIDEKLYTDVERMIYLKQAVEGKAAEVISNFEISRENFAKAWEKLRKRYENRRAVISNYLDALCKLPVAKAETDVAPLLDAATDAIESLNAVGVENGWQLMLCHLVSTKLDVKTRKQWELSIVQEEEYPTYAKLEKFLQQRVRVFESIGGTPSSTKSTSIVTKRTEKAANEKSRVLLTKEASSSSTSNDTSRGLVRACFDCGATTHSLVDCKIFVAKSIEEKTQLIQKRGLCFNCLNRGHRVAQCRFKKCEKCGRRHHVLLHREELPASQPQTEARPKGGSEMAKSELPENKVDPAKSFLIRPSATTYVCLPAALVYVFGANGHRYTVRASLDSARGINVISEKLAKKLRCKFTPSKVTVATLMPGQLTVSHSCYINVKSRFNAFRLEIKCQVTPNIAHDFQSYEGVTPDEVISYKYQLADNPLVNPGCVDLLIGAEFYEELMLTGKIKVADKAYLRETEFGWIFLGLASSVELSEGASPCYLTVEANLQKFWALDEMFELKDSWTEEERRVDEEFERTFTRLSDGKFVVRLPKNLSEDMLGESRNIAFRRLIALERRLQRQEQVRQDYGQFLEEYEALGHMTLVDDSEAFVYLPHHAVFKESSTTRTRVVFNAAALTSSGYSLNDFLAKGPVLQEDLLSILMRFRSYRVAFTADVEKMYRQTLVHPEDRKFQCILWRSSETGKVNTYRLNTVTYGTKPASYLATKCLFKLAEIFASVYERSADIVKSDFYMDDLLSGAEDVESAKARIKEVREILSSGGFNLRKFAASCPEVLTNLDPNVIVESRTFEDIEAVSVLGVRWTCSDGDHFRFFNKLMVSDNTVIMTKRLFLSQVFRIYDPLGLLAPIVISLKFLLQELWRTKLGWDSPVPSDVLERFNIICRALESLPSLLVPRWTGFTEQSEIHIFCDASQRGYGAAAYVRTVVSNGEVTVNLLCSKSRVAPIKVVSIPRLELCAALLGAKLFGKIRSALRLPETAPVFAWSDSTIVLSWLYFENGNCSTFVANRVSKIRAIVRSDRWFHVRSEENAADIISRGIDADILSLHQFWAGPSFLRARAELQPDEVELDPLMLEECKVKARTYLISESNPTIFFFQRFSNYESLISFVAYIMRFSKSLREERYESLELSVFERVRAHNILVRRVQTTAMSKISALDSFADEEGIWRLRSRIGKSDLTFESKYPVILPKDRFFLLLVRYWHQKYFHAGITFLKNFIRTSFHVLGDLNRIIRGVIHGCVTCRRFAKDLHYSPPEGELPACRITVSQAFTQVGVDFAGPFQTRAVGPGRNRSKVLFKSYVAVFVCMVSRAAHIEVVEDLSTKAFLECFDRFLARRGLCQTVYSDHGTNFVGADRELRVAFEFLKRNRSEFTSYCSKLGIQWQFIPERAPHFGGLWEAAVKSFKFHFKRVVGTQILSFTELTTLSCRIEAILNTRPLCTAGDNSTTVITPAHLCIGKALAVAPPIRGEVVKGAVKVRYSMVQSMFERFWFVWRQEYLIGLRRHSFKKVGAPQAQVDDIVLLKEDKTSPAEWPMGRIIRCYPGPDQICRVVDVFSNGKVFKRPVVKLIPLLPE